MEMGKKGRYLSVSVRVCESKCCFTCSKFSLGWLVCGCHESVTACNRQCPSPGD